MLKQQSPNEPRKIARMDRQDYLEYYFGELWAKFPFNLEISEQAHQMLYNA